MIRVKTASFNKSQYLFTALFFAIILSSCASLSSLDKAQDDFNKAAEMENDSLLNLSSNLAILPKYSDDYYRSAYIEVNNALEKEAQLKKLEVYVDAILIKSLCEWKLENVENEKAIITARAALDYMGPADKAAKDRPRDYAVLSALSALIGIEEMNVHQDTFFKAPDLSSVDAKAEYEKIVIKENKVKGNIQQDIDDLIKIRKKISDKHDVQTYLIMCQLSAVKVWDDALSSVATRIEKNAENKEWYDGQKVDLEKGIDEYLENLKERIGEDHDVYKHWKTLFRG